MTLRTESKQNKIYKSLLYEVLMDVVHKNDFVELIYTGYSGGEIFDSNIEEDLKTLDSKAKVEKTIIVVARGNFEAQVADPTGIEPAISSSTERHVNRYTTSPCGS